MAKGTSQTPKAIVGDVVLFHKRDGFNETQKSLVDVSLSLVRCPHSARLCKLSYCCHQPPLHPHFHLYPIFHFISMLIWEDKKNPCYVIL